MIRTRLLAPGLGSILAAVVIWGTMPFIINFASRELLPGELATARMLLAGALLTAATDPGGCPRRSAKTSAS